jgi:hypothetical protein
MGEVRQSEDDLDMSEKQGRGSRQPVEDATRGAAVELDSPPLKYSWAHRLSSIRNQ